MKSFPANFTLNSPNTAFVSYGMPAMMLAALVICCNVALNNGGAAWLLPAFVGVVGLIIFDLSRKIKFVEYRDGNFIITGFMKTITVPGSHLFSLTDDWAGRSPAILLCFQPPTSLGPVVIVMPPRRQFHQIADIVRQMVIANQADRGAWP